MAEPRGRRRRRWPRPALPPRPRTDARRLCRTSEEVGRQGQNKGYQLTIANALWGQKGYNFQQAFLELTRSQYGASLTDLDFASATEESRRRINAWVEQQTKDKIKELLKPGVLDGLTRLVLTNAVYFKGDWERRSRSGRPRTGPSTYPAVRKPRRR